MNILARLPATFALALFLFSGTGLVARADSWRPLNPGGDGRPLYKLWFASATTGWTVGQDGLIYATTNGGTLWSQQASGTLNALNSVFGINTNNVWAVGAGGTILKWNGTAWGAQTSGTTQALNGVWVGDASNAWAVGAGGTILKWNGTAWSAQASGTTEALNGVWGSDASNVWAVGANGTILKWDGATWSAQTSGTVQALTGVSGSDASNVWAVGAGGTICKWNGSAWNAQTSGVTTNFLSVWGADANIVYAVGSSGQILKTTNGGATWGAQTSGVSLISYGVWGSDANNVWVSAVGAIHKGNGTTWIKQASFGNPNGLNGVWSADANNVWTVGTNGPILKWNGGAWATQVSLGTSLRAVWGANTNTVWAVGLNGAISRTTNGGATWSTQTSGTTQFLNRVWGSDANNVWVVGAGGTILRWDGTSWSTQTSGTTQELRCVWGTDASNVWAVGVGGTILKWNGSVWAAQTSGTTLALYGVWGSDANNLWAVGASGTIRRTTNGGATWSAQTSGTTLALRAVWGSDASKIWAVGDFGTIRSTISGGATWSAEPSTTAISLLSVSGSSATSVVAVGATGLILTNAPAPTAPTVTTPTSSGVTASSATLGGNVTGDGGAAVTERGVVVSLTSANANPVIGGSGVTKVTASGTTGVFTVPVSGLSQSSGYGFKAYATNYAGTTYTGVSTFSTPGIPPTVNGITPASGRTAGGTGVTITGTLFTGATAVTIGGAAATGLTVVNATTITATTPAGTAGPASVHVISPGGTNEVNTLFTYLPNTVPSNLTLGNATLAENNAPNATVGVFSVTDPDALDTHAYAFQSGAGGEDNAAFSISGNTLRLNGAADFETQSSYAIRVVATDNGTPPLSVVNTFTISIQNVNEPPAFTAGTVPVVNEDAGPQTVTGWATGIHDGDSTVAQTLSFSVGATSHPGLFSAGPAVDANTGDLTYTTAVNSNGTATVEIVLTDDTSVGGPARSVTNLVTFTVNPVNDDPILPGTVVTAEDAGPVLLPGWANDGDPELVQTLFHTIVTNNNPALFLEGPVLHPNGDLTYTSAANSNGTAIVQIILTDDATAGGPARSVTNLVTFTVEAVNDQPSIDFGTPIVVAEDSGPHSISDWKTALEDGDPEVAQTMTLALQSVQNPALFSAGPTLDANGTLDFALTPGANGSSKLWLRLVDDATAGGGPRTNVVFLQVYVPGVNGAPSFTGGPALTVPEASTLRTTLVGGWATNFDDGEPYDTQSLFLSSQNNSNPGLFASGPTLSLNGTITYSLAPHANGSATVEFVLTDDATRGGPALSATNTLSFTVTPVNGKPAFVAGPAPTVDEDSGPQTLTNWATGISDGDTELAQSLSFSLGSNSNPGLFSAGPAVDAAGTLTFTPAPNANGLSDVQIVLTDDASAGGPARSVTNSVRFTVNKINDPPSFTAGAPQVVNEDLGMRSTIGWASNLNDGDANVTQSLTFSIASNSNPSLFSGTPVISSVGTLTYTSAPNANGSAVLQVVLTDDTLAGGPARSVTNTLSITVIPVNDRPVIPAGILINQVADEDAGPQVRAGWINGITDGDPEVAQTMTFAISYVSNPGLFSAQPTITPTGDFTWTPAPNASGTALLNLRVIDDATAGGSAQITTSPFKITVNKRNDAPSFAAGGPITVNEDAGARSFPAWATAITDGDSETLQALSFSVTNNTDAALFSVAPAVTSNGTLTFTPAPNANGTASMQVVLTDDTLAGGPALRFTNTLSVTVTAINDEPSFVTGSNLVVAATAGAQTLPGWATVLSDNDPEVVQNLSFEITGNSNPGILSGAPALSPDGTLSFTPASGVCGGTTTISVRLHDDGGTDFGGDDTSPVQTFTVSVGSPEIDVRGPNGVALPADTLAFGERTAGQSLARSLVLANPCGLPLELAGISLASGTVFSLAPGAPGVIPGGGQLTLTLTFAPSAPGVYSDTLVIHSNDPDEPVTTILLTGTGTPAFVPLPCSPNATTDSDTVVHAAAAGDSSQGQTMAAGDVNGDGIADWVVALPMADAAGRADSGRLAVYFGGSSSTNDVFDLAGTHGTAPDVVVNGAAAGHKLGLDGALRLGDLNGDGLLDILVAAPLANTTSPARSQAGMAYLLFGRAIWTNSVDLASPGAAVALLGGYALDNLALGGALAVGDFDGDGFQDIALGSGTAIGPSGQPARSKCGRAFLVRGRASWPASVDLRYTADILVFGAESEDRLTEGGALAFGDVNGDGRADLVLGAQRADGPANARDSAGEAYVVRGRTLTAAQLKVDLALGEQDQTILGASTGDQLSLGSSLHLGDLTGDGRAEIIVGSSQGDGPAEDRANAGELAIVLGAASITNTVDLASAAPGLTRVHGAHAGDLLSSGGAIRVGNVSGDSLPELIVGAEGAAGPFSDRSSAGAVYVLPITNTWPAVIDLASPPSGSFVVHGATSGDRLTRNGALRLGDLNGDGLQDLILGADGGDGPANARAACGEVEVVFGQAAWANPFLDLSQALDGTFLTLAGGSANDELSKNNALAVGDLDGDGIVDLLAGAPGVDGPAGSARANAGALYLLRGKTGALSCGGGLLTIGFRVEPPAPAETPAPAPVIDALELAESGESANQLWGEAGYRHVLESSTDLVHWTAVAEETPARSGSLHLFDRAAAGQGTLYYRVRREQ